MHEPSLQGKSHDIPKGLVWYAWLRVKENGGAAGPDGVTIEQFQEKVQDNLYRLWNRMSSRSYFPGPVRHRRRRPPPCGDPAGYRQGRECRAGVGECAPGTGGPARRGHGYVRRG